MHEIKFRAWNGEIMSKPFTLGEITQEFFDGEPHYIDNDGVSVWWPTMKKDGGAFLQYTGLKDKNGVEIYEGDILQFGVFPGQEKAPNSEVEFIGGSFCVEHKAFRKEMSENKHGAWVYLDVEADEGEVIGNTHENPELLEAPDEAK